MLSKFIDNGELTLDIEFGNHHDFFSGSRNGYCNISNYENKILTRTLDVEIPKSKGKIVESVAISDSHLTRQLNFTSQDDAFLFDFVSRYVVLSDNRNAYISDIEIKHNNSNIYYQYPADKPVKVPLGDEHWLEFSDLGSSIEPYFDNVFYVRDESQSNGRYKWIVHHRKIVKAEYAELILRGCHPRIEGVIPYQRWIPRVIKNALFRIRETKHPYCPLMTVGIVNVKGCPLKLTTEIRLSEDA
jgi:hypothetical protein